MKKSKIAAICILLSFMMCFPSLTASAFIDDYYGAVNTVYYFGSNGGNTDGDYAVAYVTQYGGWVDGIDLNPTNFQAITYGIGFAYFNWFKYLNVEGFFYEPDMTQSGHGSVEDYISYSSNLNNRYTKSVVLYGADYVNEEYGLDTFTTKHWVYLYAPDPNHNGVMTVFEIAQNIYINTTGFSK